ncbi:MAG TPA: hypothetical protein VFB80_15890 [Pirellulaceae bacterium]|nr:hypothetical protein [Pirellulaceae bacterium]
MNSRFLTIVVTLVFCCGVTAAVLLVGEFFRRRGAAIAGLKAPDSLVLLAIDGAEDVEAKYTRAVSAGEEVFHQYAVLGQVEIADADERARIVAALQQAAVAPDLEPPGNSFRPRHALIARENGQTIEIAISFESRQYHRYGQGREDYPAISRSAEAILTRHLTDAGISLAP